MTNTTTHEPRNTGSAIGLPPKFSSRPEGVTARTNAGVRELTAMGILIALRRRWVPALMLAIPAALFASAIVWYQVPARYESAAILKIQQFEQSIAFGNNNRSTDILTYRDTQKGFIKSRAVLTSALRDPKMAECRTMSVIHYPVEWLMKELQVDEQTSPEFLKISLQGDIPEDLALIVNSVKESYLNEVVYNERNAKIEKLRKAEQSHRDVDNRVRAAQANIERLATHLGSVDPKLLIHDQGRIQMRISDFEKKLAEYNDAILAEQALQAQGLSGGLMSIDTNRSQFPSSISSGSSGVVSPLDPRSRLLQLQLEIAQFESTTRNPNHPDLLAKRQEEKRLRSLLSVGSTPNVDGTASPAQFSRVTYLTKLRDAVAAEIVQQEKLFNEKNLQMIDLEREQREIDPDVKMRESLAQQIREQQVELNAPDRISSVQDANIPEKREIKKKTQFSTIAALAVFCSIVCGFTLFEWFSYRIGAATDISSEVGLRLIGTIPSPDRGGLLGMGIFAGKVDYDEWNRAVTESMDVVRTFLMRHIDPSRSASILIAGASANEGKTTVSCQLAASLARTGKRVALVDCDLRRPSAHHMVGGQQGPGVSELMRGEKTIDEIRQQTQAPGLTFIGAGQVDQRVLQLLSIDGGRSLIQQLKSRFDFVIIDTSPLLFVAEPSMVAQNADIVLLATRKDYSRVRYVAQARDSLRSLQIPLLGAIMVGADSDFQRQTYGYQQEVVQMTGN
ncbi:MAG: AAA family ATPase [Planctomycetota bacterium]|nr:AAA family ATPase [Planctomycetota bacterium]